MRDRGKATVESLLLAPFFEGDTFKLGVVVTYHDLGSSNPSQDVLPHEYDHMFSRDCGQWLCFNPLRKVVGYD